jgi:hypothetical protein
MRHWSSEIIDRGEVSETFALGDLGGLDLTYSIKLYIVDYALLIGNKLIFS